MIYWIRRIQSKRNSGTAEQRNSGTAEQRRYIPLITGCIALFFLSKTKQLTLRILSFIVELRNQRNSNRETNPTQLYLLKYSNRWARRCNVTTFRC